MPADEDFHAPRPLPAAPSETEAQKIRRPAASLFCAVSSKALCRVTPYLIVLLFTAGPLSTVPLRGASFQFRAGVARINITPREPVWLSGYAARTRPSDGAAMELYARTLAIEDGKGHRVVLVSTDLIGLPRAITDAVSARVLREYGLRRDQILFNSSHTHSGPVVRPNLNAMFDLPAEQVQRLDAYARRLSDDLFHGIGAALGALAPAELSFGQTSASFAVNRRVFTPQGVQFGVNPQGPVDHTVPVLQVRTSDGRPLAVVFGYACHNTTLGGDYYQIHGDYAGYAQAELEKSLPGTTAMFMMLCGGDQNPEPRGTPDLARQHGESLASAVRGALAGAMKRIQGPLRSAYHVTDLAFAPHTRETFEKDLKDANVHKVRRARLMLELYERRQPIRRTPYPAQAIRFGKDLTLIALGGEVVVDYAIRARREYPKENLIIAAYCNDVMCYIPSKRVLKEGGYEADRSMIYYGMPGPFTEEVEERVFDAIHRVLRRVGVNR